MRLEHHLVGGYVRYISPHIIIIIIRYLDISRYLDTWHSLSPDIDLGVGDQIRWTRPQCCLSSQPTPPCLPDHLLPLLLGMDPSYIYLGSIYADDPVGAPGAIEEERHGDGLLAGRQPVLLGDRVNLEDMSPGCEDRLFPSNEIEYTTNTVQSKNISTCLMLNLAFCIDLNSNKI